MVNGIKTISHPPTHRGLNKGFSSKFFRSSRVRHEVPEEGRKIHRSKRCESNKEDGDNSPNTPRDENYQAFL